MCLAVPGKILETKVCEGRRVAQVQFGGITREVRLDFVPEAEVGEYVIVHVGFAISRLNAEEAEENYKLLRDMESLEGEGRAEPPPGRGGQRP